MRAHTRTALAIFEHGPRQHALRGETLEERERERQEILSELVPFMESRGYDTGALKAVVGG